MTTILDLLQQDGIQAGHASRGEYHSVRVLNAGAMIGFPVGRNKRTRTGVTWAGVSFAVVAGSMAMPWHYLMKRRGLSFWDACKAIGIDPGRCRNEQHRRAWQPEPPKAAPGAVWQAKARAFMDHCAGQLKRNSEAVAWLQPERGLNPETISRAGLGWNPIKTNRKAGNPGGSPENEPENRKAEKGYGCRQALLSLGVMMPGRLSESASGGVSRGQDSRYVVVTGSGMEAMILWQDQQAVGIVESELDGLLVQQEAGDLIGVVALGAAQQ